jgi:thiamine pyrophosphokinase
MGGFNSLGIGNEIVEETAQISFSDGLMLLVESRD